MKTTLILALIVVFPLSSFASSGFDVLTASRVSLASTQAVLASPTLPSLEAGDRFVVAIQGGYVEGRAGGPDYLSDLEAYRGNFYGKAVGLGASSRLSQNFSAFGLVAGNSIDGELSVRSSDRTQTSWWRKMSTQGVAAMLGLQYRVVGQDRSPFALGIFGGPIWISLKSSFNPELVNPSTGQVFMGQAYKSEPTILGAMAGIQTKLRVRGFLLSPYVLYVQEFSNRCKPFATPNSGDVWQGCGGDNRSADLPASFGAYGVTLGYGSVSAAVYSKVMIDGAIRAMSEIEVHQYQLSYSFGLDI